MRTSWKSRLLRICAANGVQDPYDIWPTRICSWDGSSNVMRKGWSMVLHSKNANIPCQKLSYCAPRSPVLRLWKRGQRRESSIMVESRLTKGRRKLVLQIKKRTVKHVSSCHIFRIIICIIWGVLQQNQTKWTYDVTRRFYFARNFL